MNREEAINVVKCNWPEGRHQLSEALRTLIPEFQESEDERIRKRIINIIGNNTDAHEEGWAVYADEIAWLENQKDEAQRQFNLGVQAGKEEAMYEMEKEKQPAPKYKIGDTIYFNSFGKIESMVVANIIDIGDGNPMYGDAYRAYVFEKNIIEQQPAEWSEEDERMYKAISIALTRPDAKAYLRSWYKTPEDADAWLKSLRPQPHWKPSPEQMRYLLAVINEPNNAGSESCHLAIQSLYSDLKNL